MDERTLAATDPAPATDVGRRAAPPLWLIALVLLALALLIRLPFFFPAVINWDESTYILMGQEILDGRLPYVDLWELKPPFAFLPYTAAIALLGHSIPAIRLAGALLVALTALLTYLTGKAIWSWRVGLPAAVLTIVLVSLLPNGGQAFMPEHFALVPLMAALYLLCVREPTPRTLFVAGLLLMTATLVRLNLVTVPLLVGVAVLFVPHLRPFRAAITRALAFAAGNALILPATLLPYAATGQAPVWWGVMVTGPLSYADAETPILGSLSSQLDYLIRWAAPRSLATEPFGPLVVLVWALALGGVILAVGRRPATTVAARRRVDWLLVFLAGAYLSVLVTGEFKVHYLIQVVPFMALFAAYFLVAPVAGLRPGDRLRAAPALGLAAVVALALLLSLRPVAAEYGHLMARRQAGQPLASGSAYEIAAYLDRQNAPRGSVYLMVDHIIHWFRDEAPLTAPSAHPSMIDKEYLLRVFIGPDATTEGELAKVLDRHPSFIVTPPDIWYLRQHPAARALLDQTLAADYALVRQVPAADGTPINIYRRVAP